MHAYTHIHIYICAYTHTHTVFCCCFTAAFTAAFAAAFAAAFTAALLLLCCCFTGASDNLSRQLHGALLLLYCCFTAALRALRGSAGDEGARRNVAAGDAARENRASITPGEQQDAAPLWGGCHALGGGGGGGWAVLCLRRICGVAPQACFY